MKLEISIFAWFLLFSAPLGARADEDEYVVLVPDWRSGAVHQISMAGKYEGNLLQVSAAEQSKDHRAWASPRALLTFDSEPSRMWVFAERALSEWSTQGELRKPLFSDSSLFEDPVCAVRTDDHVFTVSSDKHLMLVFDSKGELETSIEHDDFQTAKDCKIGPDGMIWVSSGIRSPSVGLISTWDPKNRAVDAKPTSHRVLPQPADDGTISVHSFVFDADDNILITDFARGRLERWSADGTKKLEVLLDSDQWGTYLDLATGPDGLIYLSGPRGLYRFDSRAKADEMRKLVPFFNATETKNSQTKAFSPSSIVFLKRALPQSSPPQS